MIGGTAGAVSRGSHAISWGSGGWFVGGIAGQAGGFYGGKAISYGLSCYGIRDPVQVTLPMLHTPSYVRIVNGDIIAEKGEEGSSEEDLFSEETAEEKDGIEDKDEI